MLLIESARVFFRGPIWKVAGGVSLVFGIFGAVQETKNLHAGSIWMWLFFGSLALVAAAFYTFHRQRMEQMERARSLPSKIDDIHREGMAELEELRAPYEPKRDEHGITIEPGAPPEWWKRAEALDHRVRALFRAELPALLSDYTEAQNESLRNAREKEEAHLPDPENDPRSDHKKVLAMARRMHNEPAQYVEACLDGLTAARYRVAGSVP
jgi:hypothetical protein